MSRNNIQLNFLLILFIFFFTSCKSQENIGIIDYNRISIRCNESESIVKDDLLLVVQYVNNSLDTIILPYSYMKSRNFQEFIFPNKEIEGGIDTDYYLPKSNKNNECLYSDIINANYLKIILPNETLEIEYSLKDLGYQNVKGGYDIGKEYTYYIKLNIPKEFKNICSNMWTGHVESNMGSFIIK